jgi:hypothetical protein
MSSSLFLNQIQIEKVQDYFRAPSTAHMHLYQLSSGLQIIRLGQHRPDTPGLQKAVVLLMNSRRFALLRTFTVFL